MQRARKRTVQNSNASISELDYLLGVYDLARQGALRFSKLIDGPFLSEGNEFNIPPFIKLPELIKRH